MGKYLDSSGVTYLWQKIKDTFLAKADYKQNDKTTAGYVAAPGAVANKVWKTNANGEPAWRDDADTVYTHPSYTARTGKPTANATPAFGGTFTVSQITSDATGHVTNATDRTITIPSTVATASAAGLMSAENYNALAKLVPILVPNIDGVSTKATLGDGASMIHFGTCSTNAATTGKTVACAGFNLETGSWIAVKFSVTNTGAVGSLTLNVNSTGAKSIKYRGGNLPSAGTLAANRVYFFVYDGTNWELIGDLDTNTTYTGTSPITVSGTAISHANSGVTAASKGDTANQTPTWGGTFKVPSGTVNATGHLTAFADHTVTIPSTEASTSAAGLMSKADKTKLNGIETGAQANVPHLTSVTVGDAVISPSSTGTENVTLKQGGSVTLDADATSGVVTISSAGEANQNAFSTIKAGTAASPATIAADSKTDTISFVSGSNVTIAAAGKVVTISATNTTYTNMTQSEATTGTATTARSISAKVLNDTIANKIASAQVGAALFQGAVSAASTITGAAYKKGWYWVVGTAGTYCGQVCEAGDMIYAIADKGSAYKDADFTVVQNNIDTMSTSDIDTAIAAA